MPLCCCVCVRPPAEATSALDLENERSMYECLMAQRVTYVSVGHRPSLLAYHNSKLVLRGPGEVPAVVPLSNTDAAGAGTDTDFEGLGAVPVDAAVQY